VATPPDVPSITPSGAQGDDSTAGSIDGQVAFMDGQATPPPAGDEAQ
jgi:hypothetical protein